MELVDFVLGDLIDIKHGFAFKGEYFCDEEKKDVLITPGNFKIGGGFKNDKLKFYDGPIPKDFILRSGDIIVTMTDLSKEADTLGYSAKVPKSEAYTYLHNQRIGLIELLSSSVDSQFLYWILRTESYQKFVAGSASGATVKHTSPNKIRAFEFKAPKDKLNQKKIALILNSYEDLIENNLNRIKLTEEILHATYEEWFVRMNFPGHQTAKFDKVTGLPDGWKRTILSEAIQINPSTKVSKKESAPYVPMGSLSTSSMIIDGVESRIPSGGAKFKNGDTLVARITPCLENGKTGFVDFLFDEQVATGSTEFIVLRESPEINRFFIYCLARSEYFRGFSINNMLGSDGRQRVNHKAYNKYSINIPPQNIMERFKELASPAFMAIKNLVHQNELLKEARDILLPRLMTGMIDIEQVELPEAMLKRLEQQEDKMAAAV